MVAGRGFMMSRVGKIILCEIQVGVRGNRVKMTDVV